MVEQTSEEELQELKETFNKFDKSGDGSIDTSELLTALQAMGILMTKAEAEEMIKEQDLDENGTLDFPEFVKIFKQKYEPPEEVSQSIKECFRLFDKNGDGTIDRDELTRILTQIGQDKVRPEDVDEMFNAADLDKDGKIDIDEFAKTIAGC